MQVALISELERLFNEGVDRYQPVFPGVDLEEETGDPDVSTRNLNKLLEGNVLVDRIVVHPKDKSQGRVLLLLTPGVEYLALGFGLDRPEKMVALTRFAASIGYGDYERLMKFYGLFSPEYDGLLPGVTPERPRIHVEDDE